MSANLVRKAWNRMRQHVRKGRRSNPGKSRRAASQLRPSTERLEDRRLMAGITFNALSGQLTIFGSQQSNSAVVRTVGNQIQAQLQAVGSAAETRSFAANSVSSIRFYVGPSSDTFVNLTAKPVQAFGGAGNDMLIGGQANDLLDGGGGNDLIDGDAGNDVLYGGVGNDIVLGNFGRDQLYGGDGDDFLHGGEGNDVISGDAGNDILVGGSNLDTLTDYQGYNSFYDSAMSLGRSYGFYRGNYFSRYFEGQCLGNNLTSTDLLLRYKTKSTYTGYGDAVDQIMAAGQQTSQQNLTQLGLLSPSPATTMLRDSINQLWPS